MSPAGTSHPGCLVFTGHRIDAQDRPSPRFPAKNELAVREMIRQAMREVRLAQPATPLRAITSAAQGGDILFLELCAEMDIEAEIFLAAEPEEFDRLSVADGGAGWSQRYRTLLQRFPVHVLPDDPDSELNIWQRTNLWMLEEATRRYASELSVMALWDGDDGDGAGGTKDMVDRARTAGAHVLQLDPTSLL